MDIIVHGCTGRMGTILSDLIQAPESGHTLAAGIAPGIATSDTTGRYASLEAYEGEADCVIDFSSHNATAALTAWCVWHEVPLVIATTGQTEEENALIHAAGKQIPLFFAANMSIGIAVLSSLARQAAAMFPEADIEIIERHHNQKKDVPSGTALLLASSLQQARPDAELVIGRHENGIRTKSEIGIHSLRYGNEVGTHEIIISDGSETITLKHEAENRSLFARGALAAASFLQGKAPGLYTMADLVAAG
ncbi:MAG: 4-hydroxy-tetrahydrodipicolinate reductase [Oscillospiraceae bacterium]|nr:4-hydroxy-tetrahydrodipicolinate reductase [Oscillospiraceae bacterium]